MRRWWRRWWRKRRLIRAYKAMRGIAESHRAAGHSCEFVAVNESRLHLECPCGKDLP